MDIKIIIDDITSFLIDPSKEDRRPVMQGLAWASTLLLAVASIGLVQGLSVLWRHLRRIDTNKTQEKIVQLFQKIFTKNSEDDPSSKEANSFNSGNAAKVIFCSNNSSKTLSFQEIAKNIYDSREKLWSEAQKKANKDNTATNIHFINLIIEEFKNNDKSLSNISIEPEALNILFQSARIRAVIVAYAKVNQIQKLLDYHLIFLVKDIYDHRDEYANLAIKNSTGDTIDNIAYLTNIVRIKLKTEGRSLVEIFNNAEALEIFKKSGRLTLILSFYAKMKQASQQNHSSEKGNSEIENERLKEAIRLARSCAQGPGLVTRVGLNEFQSNEKQLLKCVKKFLLLNHPDKNPEAAPELVQEANQILDMLRNNVYGPYKAALDRYRGNPNAIK